MFNKHTDTRVETLICGELRTAKEQYGETFNSLHEAYAVALEELEEANADFENAKTAFSYFWEDVANDCSAILDLMNAKNYAIETIKELAQFAAVIEKTLETLDEKEKNNDLQ